MKFIRKVTLNKNGKHIGDIVEFKLKGKIIKAYKSYRKPIHYFRIHQGFGIDKTLLKNLVSKMGIEWILIDYDGVRERKLLLSNVDNWFFKGEEV